MSRRRRRRRRCRASIRRFIIVFVIIFHIIRLCLSCTNHGGCCSRGTSWKKNIFCASRAGSSDCNDLCRYRSTWSKYGGLNVGKCDRDGFSYGVENLHGVNGGHWKINRDIYFSAGDLRNVLCVDADLGGSHKGCDGRSREI